MSKISKVKARQVFDSRGNPTIEAEVYSANQSASAICPSGASTGTHEAFEKRDKFNKTEVSKLVAQKLAKKAQEKKITKIYFDRGSYKYHGRIKVFAETLRENGMEF